MLLRSVTLLCLVCWFTPPASAATTDDWFDALTARVIDDVTAGKPVVVEVHVPLCDSSIIPCGNKKLGDGDNPSTNLYWSTTPGFGVWFERKHSGWKRVLRTTTDTGDSDVLELLVYRRTVSTPATWRKRGAPRSFELDVVIHGWRGTAIDRALAAYADDLAGTKVRTVTLDDGSTLTAGGSAQLVSYVGHNRLMDLESYSWPAPPSDTKGTIAIACHTAAYMKRDVPAATRVPLLMTSDFLFSNAAPLEAAVLAFVSGGGYARIRSDATSAYASVQKQDVKRLRGVFTNPSDKRWAR